PEEKPGQTLRARGGRILYPPPARVGAAVVKETLSTRKRHSERLRPRRRERSSHEKYRANGTVGPALSPCNRWRGLYRSALRLLKERALLGYSARQTKR